MRRFAYSLAVVALVSTFLLAQSNPSPSHPNPEVAALLDKVAEAYGGWAKVRSVHAIRRQSTGRNSSKAWKIDSLTLPDRLRAESDYPGFTISIIISPQLGVGFAEGKQDHVLTAAEKEDLSRLFRFNVFFMLQRALDPAYEFSVMGGEAIGQAETRILEVKAYGVRDWVYVDAQTGRILRDLEVGPDGSRSTVDYSDWFTGDAITGPVASKQTTVNAKGEASSSEFRITGYELNPPVDYRLFDREGPSLASTPIHPAPMLPAPEPVRTAVLSFRTQPGNAQVYLNDEFRGASSDEGYLAVTKLKPGSYRLRVSITGYKQWAQSLTLAAGDDRVVEARLQPAGPKPLALGEIEEALANGLPSKGITKLVEQYGVDFTLTKEIEQRLRSKGADDALLVAIATNKK